MRRILLILVCLSVPAVSRADHPFGLGFQLGAPTGLSAKLYLTRPMALQFGLGYEPCCREFQNGLHIHTDVLWHPVLLARHPDFVVPFYLGVGARLLEHGYPNTYNDHFHFGVRVPFGILMDFPKVQLDVFLEIAVVIDLIYTGNYPNHDRADINGGIGLRYYF